MARLRQIYSGRVRNMKKMRCLPLAALLLGAVGAFLRYTELRTGFDPVSGLASPGCAARWLLEALSAAVLAACVLLSVWTGRKLEAESSFKKAFYTKNYFQFAAMALLGLAVAVCGLVSCTLQDLMGLTGMARWVFLGLLILSGLGMSVKAVNAYTQRDSSALRLGSVIPSAFYCYWLVALYRMNAGNPVLADFLYGCLAFAAASLGACYSAGYAFGRGTLRGTVLTGTLSVYLLAVTAADVWPLPLRIVIVATAVYTAVESTCFLSALKEKKTEDAGEES